MPTDQTDIEKIGMEIEIKGRKYPVKDLLWEGDDLHLILKEQDDSERKIVLRKAEIAAMHNPLDGEPIEGGSDEK